MNAIRDELLVHEAFAIAGRDHDARLLARMFIHDLENQEVIDVKYAGGGGIRTRLYYDGGSRGNPGVAGAGVILLQQKNDG